MNKGVTFITGVGVGAGHRAVDIKKAINIAAPVEQVFDLWSNYENFPKFMSNVKAVWDLGEGRSHWVVAGPVGVSVEWDAVMTEKIPPKVLAWKSLPGSAVDHAGIIHFNSNPDGTTQVNIQMAYNPPAGAIGHVVAALFGSDPKSEMDQDLAQMKSFIETGVPPHNVAARNG
ncbi:MAG: SRPBCC family protein [Candidatus Manganitrophus sp. SA1]|nr:SRPBCC family protein [Candidatus Manganitrophus morganii]